MFPIVFYYLHSKAIQDEAYDTMLRMIRDNPLQALEFLKKNADKFSASKRTEIRTKIVEKWILMAKNI